MELFKNRLRIAMEQANISQAELCEKTKIPKSALSQYLSGNFKPRQPRSGILAKALDVSEAWLMGYEYGEPATPEDLDKWDRELNPDDKLAKEVKLIEDVQNQWGKSAADMIGLFNSLNDKGQKKAIDSVTDLTMIEQYKRND